MIREMELLTDIEKLNTLEAYCLKIKDHAENLWESALNLDRYISVTRFTRLREAAVDAKRMAQFTLTEIAERKRTINAKTERDKLSSTGMEAGKESTVNQA